MLWWLAENTIVGAILAGLVALVCRCFRPGPAVRHALWLVVLLKLLTPPLVHWPWSATDLWAPISQSLTAESTSQLAHIPTAEAVENEPADIAPQIIYVMPIEVESDLLESRAEPIAGANADVVAQPDVAQETPNLEPSSESAGWRWAPTASQVLQVWFAGAVAMGSWQVLRVWRFRRLLAGAKAAPDLLVNLVEELAGRLHVGPPTALVLSGIGSPFVWSIGRTCLVWPEELRLADNCRRSVLLHELAHLRRRDHWVGWLQLIGACVWWWNPLFWLVCRQLRENAELACDAWVVQLLPEARRAYAEALIQVTQAISQSAAPVAAFGLGAGRRREFERRLTMIMKECVPCRVPVRGLVIIGLLALAVLPGWTVGQPPPVRETKPAAPTAPAPAPEQPAQAVAAPAPVTEQPTPPLLVGPAPAGVPTLVQEVPQRIYYKPITRDGVTFYQAVPAEGEQGGDRLEQIEKQLQGLLKEVQAMRKGARTPASAPAKVSRPTNTLPEAPPGTRVRVIREGNPPRTTARIEGPATSSAVVEGGEVTLTRATYELDNGRAQALAGLLKELKNEDIEVKVDGDKITVTTSHENQRLIAPFIALLNGQKEARNIYYRLLTPVPVAEPQPPARR